MNRSKPTRHLLPALLLSLGLAAAGCAADGPPLGETHPEMVGTWSGPGVSLTITAKGHMDYESNRDRVKKTIAAPIQAVTPTEIQVGIGFLNTTFDLSSPPALEGGHMRMTVDGVVLTRAQSAPPTHEHVM